MAQFPDYFIMAEIEDAEPILVTRPNSVTEESFDLELVENTGFQLEKHMSSLHTRHQALYVLAEVVAAYKETELANATYYPDPEKVPGPDENRRLEDEMEKINFFVMDIKTKLDLEWGAPIWMADPKPFLYQRTSLVGEENVFEQMMELAVYLGTSPGIFKVVANILQESLAQSDMLSDEKCEELEKDGSPSIAAYVQIPGVEYILDGLVAILIGSAYAVQREKFPKTIKFNDEEKTDKFKKATNVLTILNESLQAVDSRLYDLLDLWPSVKKGEHPICTALPTIGFSLRAFKHIDYNLAKHLGGSDSPSQGPQRAGSSSNAADSAPDIDARFGKAFLKIFSLILENDIFKAEGAGKRRTTTPVPTQSNVDRPLHEQNSDFRPANIFDEDLFAGSPSPLPLPQSEPQGGQASGEGRDKKDVVDDDSDDLYGA